MLTIFFKNWHTRVLEETTALNNMLPNNTTNENKNEDENCECACNDNPQGCCCTDNDCTKPSNNIENKENDSCCGGGGDCCGDAGGCSNEAECEEGGCNCGCSNNPNGCTCVDNECMKGQMDDKEEEEEKVDTREDKGHSTTINGNNSNNNNTTSDTTANKNTIASPHMVPRPIVTASVESSPISKSGATSIGLVEYFDLGRLDMESEDEYIIRNCINLSVNYPSLRHVVLLVSSSTKNFLVEKAQNKKVC